MRLTALTCKLPALALATAAVAALPVEPALATNLRAYAKVTANCDYQYPPWGSIFADHNAAYWSDGCTDNNVTASGWARADFATGSMHGYASGVPGPGGSSGWGVGAGVGVMAQLMDDVWLVGSGSGGVVRFSLSYSGSFSGSVGYRSLGATLELNGQYFQENCANDVCTGTVSGTFNARTNDPFHVMAGTGVSVVAWGPPLSGDFSHTATISFTVPDGYTLYDADGPVVFAPVPEPSAVVLLAPGLALLALRRPRVSKPSAVSPPSSSR